MRRVCVPEATGIIGLQVFVQCSHNHDDLDTYDDGIHCKLIRSLPLSSLICKDNRYVYNYPNFDCYSTMQRRPILRQYWVGSRLLGGSKARPRHTL